MLTFPGVKPQDVGEAPAREYFDLDLIFCRTDGGPLDAHNLRNRLWYPLLKAAGLRRIRLHDLRHTAASLLIHQGQSIKYLQRQLRHASAQMTLNTYGHLFPETNRAAMAAVDRLLLADGSG